MRHNLGQVTAQGAYNKPLWGESSVTWILSPVQSQFLVEKTPTKTDSKKYNMAQVANILVYSHFKK